jgi:dihydroorotate dehydrogenase
MATDVSLYFTPKHWRKKMRGPFGAASGPTTSNPNKMRELDKAGAAFGVNKTGWVHSDSIVNPSPAYAEMCIGGEDMATFNAELTYKGKYWKWLDDIKWVADNLPGFFQVVSIMGANEDELGQITRDSVDAGADALEVNLGCSHWPKGGRTSKGKMLSAIGEASAAVIEKYLRIVVREAGPDIAVLSKVSPNPHTAIPQAEGTARARGDGVVTTNTARSLAGWDDDDVPRLNIKGNTTPTGMSGPALMPIALHRTRECAAYYRETYPKRGLVVSGAGGVKNFKGARNFFRVGARHVSMCSALMHDKDWAGVFGRLNEELYRFMESKGFDSFEQVPGFGLDQVVDFEQAVALSRGVTVSLGEDE